MGAVAEDRLPSPPARKDEGSYSETFDSYSKTEDASDKSTEAPKKVDATKDRGENIDFDENYGVDLGYSSVFI